ncbi:MAG: CocE/NonD family hydrolase, partial [Pseudomonadales bacterium]
HRGNRYPDAAIGALTYRDSPDNGHQGFLYSPAGYIDEYRATQTPLLLVSGWADGAYQLGALRKYRSRPAHTWVVIGPWSHGPGAVTDPCAGSLAFRGRRSDLTIPFFNRFLKGEANGFDEAPPIRYYTYCANEWKYAHSWPPEGSMKRFSFGSLGTLVPQLSREETAVELPYDDLATSGGATRWVSLVDWRRKTRYADRADQAEHGVGFSSQPMADDVTISGSPVISLSLEALSKDAAVFAYLEDVAPDGSVTYITEGQLRLLHRATTDRLYDGYSPVRSFSEGTARELIPGERYEVSFGLYPISYRFAAGHRLQVTLTRADADNFLPIGPSGEGSLLIFIGGASGSRIQLPIEANGRPIWERSAPQPGKDKR